MGCTQWAMYSSGKPFTWTLRLSTFLWLCNTSQCTRLQMQLGLFWRLCSGKGLIAQLKVQIWYPDLCCLQLWVSPSKDLTNCWAIAWTTWRNYRIPSTYVQNQNRWKLFSAWCTVRNEDPPCCSVGVVLEFLLSTLPVPWCHTVYVDTISALQAMVSCENFPAVLPTNMDLKLHSLTLNQLCKWFMF